MKLSILIPTTEDRKFFNRRIEFELYRQIDGFKHQVELLWDYGHETTGFKRNRLIENANGEYVAFVDSDDQITDVYIKKQLEVANSGLDCGELWGLYFLNGKFDRPFHHTMSVSNWHTEPTAYKRCNNHLNAIKRDIMLKIPFPDKTVGEDGVQSMALKDSGLIKTEHPIKETLYLYYDRTK